MTAGSQHSNLLVRCRTWLCVLPLAEVIETLRLLPLQPVAGAPGFVRGLTLIRGELLPVVELALLLGAEDAAPGGRLVVVRAANRRLALAVDEVLRVLPQELPQLSAVAPLLSKALPAQVAALAV